MLARLYRAHHHRHMEDLPFWESFAKRSGDPILELGCGTGRILLPLLSQGHQMFGIDLDGEMLAVLREQLTSHHGRAHIIQADIKSFALAQRFSTILLPCNTFSTFSQRERQEALHNIRRHLSPEGLFAVSVPNPALLKSLPASSPLEYEEQFDHPLDGNNVIVGSGWKRSPGQLTFEWVYEHTQTNTLPLRYHVYARHYLTSTKTYYQDFATCGLRVVEAYGDFDFTPLSPDAPFLILIAGKN